MQSTIVIPKLCKVGCQTGRDTYNGKLGYVIWHDGKKWRKEPSWEGWRHKHITEEEFIKEKNAKYEQDIEYALRRGEVSDRKTWKDIKVKTREEVIKVIGTFDEYGFNPHGRSTDEDVIPKEFANDLVEGFVLNKKAGGNNYSWNPRQTYCRVFDPRGFEIEITIPNLLYILENTNSIKGKGLEGKFCYGWSGKDLVLVPEDAPEYKEMLAYTNLQDLKVKKSDLKVGGVYRMSDNTEEVYLGDGLYYDYYGRTDNKKVMRWAKLSYDFTREPAIDNDGEVRYYGLFTHYSGMTRVKQYVRMLESVVFADIMNKLEIDREYKTRVVEYVPFDFEEFISNGNYSRNSRACYIKEKNKHRKIEIYYNVDRYGHRYDRDRDPWQVKVGREESETFKNVEKIKEKYELWQQRMIK